MPKYIKLINTLFFSVIIAGLCKSQEFDKEIILKNRVKYMIIKSAKDSSLECKYYYNTKGNLISVTDDTSVLKEYKYDEKGNLVNEVNYHSYPFLECANEETKTIYKGLQVDYKIHIMFSNKKRDVCSSDTTFYEYDKQHRLKYLSRYDNSELTEYFYKDKNSRQISKEKIYTSDTTYMLNKDSIIKFKDAKLYLKEYKVYTYQRNKKEPLCINHFRSFDETNNQKSVGFCSYIKDTILLFGDTLKQKLTFESDSFFDVQGNYNTYKKFDNLGEYEKRNIEYKDHVKSITIERFKNGNKVYKLDKTFTYSPDNSTHDELKLSFF